MTKILLRKQLAEIFRTYLYDAKKNKARSKGTVIAYFVLFALLMVGLLGGMFTFLAFTLRSTWRLTDGFTISSSRSRPYASARSAACSTRSPGCI